MVRLERVIMPRTGNTKNVGRHYVDKTRVARVDAKLTNHQLKSYRELLELMELYEDECTASPSPRNEKFLKFMEEVHLLIDEP